MNLEIILFGVVALVLVLDFVLRGFKKKTIKEDVERIGEENIERNLFRLNYFLSRKRNVLSFIILTILLKPVFVYLISPNYFEHIDYDKKIERESYLDDKAKLLNTYPTTRIGMPGSPSTTGIFLENYPKNSSRWNGLGGHDSILLFEVYKITKYASQGINKGNIETSKGNFFNLGLFGQLEPFKYYSVRGSKYEKSKLVSQSKEYKFSFPVYLKKINAIPMSNEEIWFSLNYIDNASELIRKFNNEYERIYYYDDSGSEIDVKFKLLEFEKIPSIDEMIKCCNIYYDFKKDSYFDKAGNQLLHIPSIVGQQSPHKFYFYPLIKKVDSFRSHFKGTFKSKPEFFGVSSLLVGLLVFLFNDKIKAR